MNEKNKVGRSSKYETHVKPRLDEIKRWYEEGCLDADVMKRLGISHDTFYRYKNQYPEFSEVIDEGKRYADDVVASKLFQLACGFYYDEEVVTNKGDVVTVKKYAKPEYRAISFWLRNRDPENWRDKRDIEIENVGKAWEIVIDGINCDQGDNEQGE